MAKKNPPEQYRVTMLTSIYTCGYKAANEPYVADINNTYHGDIFNVFANSQGDISEAFIKHYTKNIKPDIKLAHTLKIIGDKGRSYVDGLYAKHQTVAQEAHMFIYYNRDIIVTGTPDIQYKNDELDLWCVEDLKCSTHSWYSGNEMRDLNMQTYVYPLFVMNYQGVDEVGFRYIIADKNNGKLKCEPAKKDPSQSSREDYIIRTRFECEQKLKEVMEDYVIPYKDLDIVQARRNKLCMFCDFKDTTCPLKSVMKVSSTVVDQDDDRI